MSGKLLGTGRRRNLRRLVMTVIEKGYDRGPAKYFHGRKGVLSAFKERCDHALSTGRGTTFLIQGAQGAGKTALLYKCMEQAESHGWTTLLTDYTALIDPPVLRELLGLSSKLNQALQLGSRDVAVQDVKLGPASLKLGAPSLGAHGLQRRMQRVLRGAAGNHGLLLVVDEAQHLGNLRDYRYRVELENVLTSIHNGTVGAPVILLVGGLSTTENAFDAFSISRFENSCKVYLQRLSPKSARNVLRDYLTISGQVHGQEKELDRWIREMDQRTHGWPAHIAGWGELAAEVLRDDGGQLTAEAWASVEQAGRERDNSYYQSRTSGTKPRDVDDADGCGCFQHLFLLPSCCDLDRIKLNAGHEFYIDFRGLKGHNRDRPLSILVAGVADEQVIRPCSDEVYRKISVDVRGGALGRSLDDHIGSWQRFSGVSVHYPACDRTGLSPKRCSAKQQTYD